MKRLLALVALGALTALGAGCDLSPPAATADGVAISQSQLNDQLVAVSGHPVAQCALSILATRNGASLPPVTGEGDSTVTTQFAAYALNGLVQQALEQHALDTRHVTITPADVEAARQDYEAQLGAASTQVSSPCGLTGTSLLARLPKSFVDQQARALAYQEKLEEVVGGINVSPSGLLSYYRSHLTLVTQVCLNLIVADTQAAAQAIHDKVAAGTSVAQASQGAGVDQQSPPGGQVACVYPGTVVSNFGQSLATTVNALADSQLAPVLSLPIPSSTGATTTFFLVVQMRAHRLVPFAQAEIDLRRGLLSQGGNVLNTVIGRLVAGAHVTLDPRYGTWKSQRGVTVPPTPPTAVLLNPSVGGSGVSSSTPGGLSGTTGG